MGKVAAEFGLALDRSLNLGLAQEDARLSSKLVPESMRKALPATALASAFFSLAFLGTGTFFLFALKLPQALLSLLIALASLRAVRAHSGIVEMLFRKDLERGLSNFISKYSLFLSLGTTPEKAFLEASQGEGAVEILAKEILVSSKKGIPLATAIENVCGRVGSERAVRAFSAIGAVLVEGYDRSAKELLEGISEGLSDEDKSILERDSARSQVVFVSIVFTSAIIPAVFAVASSVSGGAQGFLVPFAFLIVFPAIALAQYSYVRFSGP